jgi:hypothetical protein
MSKIDELAQQARRDPPSFAFAQYRARLGIDTGNGADTLAQVLVGKADRIAGLERRDVGMGRRRRLPAVLLPRTP